MHHPRPHVALKSSQLIFFSAVVTAAILVGCEREIPIDPSSREVEGYLIEGYVTNRFGIPFAHVDIKLNYDLILVNQHNPTPRSYVVTNSQEYINVIVQDARGGLVRTLAARSFPIGRIEYTWDQKLPAGEFAPSGLYHVRYVVDGHTRHSYPVLVTNTVTARTNAEGFFTIPDARLPIGFEPVPVYGSNNSVFYGNHRIGARIFLGFLIGGTTRTYAVHPTKNRVTRFDVMIN